MYSPQLLSTLNCQRQTVSLSSGATLNFLTPTPQPDLPPLLLIHGLGQNALVWARFMQLCVGTYNCLAVDLPGHGESPALTTKLTIDRFAATLAEGLEELGWDQVTVVGHSMGGQIASRMAINYGARLKKLILLAPGGYELFTKKEALRIEMTYSPWLLAKINLSRFTQQIKEGFQKYPSDFDPILHYLRAIRQSPEQYEAYCQTLSKCMSAIMRDPLIEEAAQLDHSLTVVWASGDRTIPNPILHTELDFPTFFADIKAGLPNAAVEALPGVGHNLQWEGAEVIYETYL